MRDVPKIFQYFPVSELAQVNTERALRCLSWFLQTTQATFLEYKWTRYAIKKILSFLHNYAH